MSWTRTSRLGVGLLAAGTLLLAGCTGSADGSGAGSSDTPSPVLPTSTVSVPPGATLTPVGERLSFGDTGTVIYESGKDVGSVLELTVTRVTQATSKDLSAFILDARARASTPYFVQVTATNLGPGQLGGKPVPLWGVDATNTLLPATTFTTGFPRCPSAGLPPKFPPGATAKTCLVYLAPEAGTLRAVSFRPNQQFDPIEWTGPLVAPTPAPPARKPA